LRTKIGQTTNFISVPSDGDKSECLKCIEAARVISKNDDMMNQDMKKTVFLAAILCSTDDNDFDLQSRSPRDDATNSVDHELVLKSPPHFT